MSSPVVLSVTQAQRDFLFAVAEKQPGLFRFHRAGENLAQRGFLIQPLNYSDGWKLTKRGKALLAVLSDSPGRS